MSDLIKLATNLTPFSRISDRFVPGGYRQGLDFAQQLQQVTKVEGISAVALGWPGPYGNPKELCRLLQDNHLELATLDTDIYTEPRFKQGSLSNPDAAIRQAALDRIKETMDAAAEIQAPDINLWPGHDGFEYAFQSHYVDSWKWLCEGLALAADHNPQVRISIEPKCKEPRANQFLANTGKALWLIRKIGKANLGLTLDFGHSLAALENPAEAAVLAMTEKKLHQVHLNDNYRDWDHDLLPGTVTFWEHVEFFFWLLKLGYQGWYSLDMFPYRQDDGTAVLKTASMICHKCSRIAKHLLQANFDKDILTCSLEQRINKLWDIFSI